MKNFNPKKNILALDFDGVIANSITECLVTGHNAYAIYEDTEKVESIDQLDSGWVEQAKAMRNFIRNGEDYVYIALALDDDADIKSQQDFDNFKNEHNDRNDDFFKIFYNERLRFANEQPRQWAALNPLYDGMALFLKSVPRNQFYIITTKKLVFVNKILHAHGLYFLNSNLHDTSPEQSKRDIIESIIAERRIKPESLYFVDDQVDTLIKTQPSGINCVFAEWGYNNPAQQQTATENDITTMDLDTFYHTFSFERSV